MPDQARRKVQVAFAPNEDAVAQLVSMIGQAYTTGRLVPYRSAPALRLALDRGRLTQGRYVVCECGSLPNAITFAGGTM